VSHFIEEIFTRHNTSEYEIFAYSVNRKIDKFTERIQALVEHWVSVAGMPDPALYQRIESDKIDVLIDLSGHTGNNRLGVFARRAAPVQAHYLGYFASTGLSEMDYWIGDSIITPPQTDHHFAEQVWRLPRTWVCYGGRLDAPECDWRPSSDGTIYLGSFNNLGKLTAQTLALWARVLQALPEGKLLLKTKELDDIVNRVRILQALGAHGIESERVELQGRSLTPNWSAHMAYYNRLDIALDPVGGVGGGTTTADALWMGLPVVTLIGQSMGQRMTASMLDAVGHPEWIAESESEYVDKVVHLARDVALRGALRPDQREKMRNSPLCDAAGLTRSLEDAYEEMFSKWWQEAHSVSHRAPTISPT
jgi:predicted O-linked N-acetylglucosamine transferase (SPINDLY family)